MASSEPLTADERRTVLSQLDDVFDRARAVHERVERWAEDDGDTDELNVLMHRHLCGNAFRRVLAVDGSIGVGKTTVCRNAVRALRRQLPQERHRLVTETVLDEMLAMFYADPDDMAERFQFVQCAMCLSSARLALIESGRAGGTVLLDRSPLGNLSFALVHYLAGRITETAFRAYKVELCSAGFVAFPTTVHLYAPAEILAQRIKTRMNQVDPARQCESSVDIEYLRRLDAVMLLVSAYAAATGVSQVRFLDWTRFGSVDQLLVSSTTANAKDTWACRFSRQDLDSVASHSDLLRMVGLLTGVTASERGPVLVCGNTNNNNNMEENEAPAAAIRVPS